MANEAILIFQTALPIPFTVANGVGIEKGTVAQLTDPMTAVAQSTADEMIAGITSTEKIASDGVTKVGVYREGIFKMTLSGACIVGDALGSDEAPNMVKRVSAVVSGARILGIALETGADNETILVELKPSNAVAD